MKKLILPTIILVLISACGSIPKVTITEQEHLDLQRKVRVLERELAETRQDYDAAKGEALMTRERIRKIEYPLTAIEQAEKENCGVSVPAKRDTEQEDEGVLAIRRSAQEWCDRNGGCL